MGSSSERPRPSRLGRVVAGAIAFSLFAPPALFALPLAALLALSRPRAADELVVGGAAAGFALWWLLIPGALPDQFVRAAGLIATAVFIVTTLRTRASFTHRALTALGLAAAALYTLSVTLGRSWGELRWWVAHETGLAARAALGQLWLATASGSASNAPRPLPVELETWLAQIVALVAEFYPAIVVLQLMTGFAVATAIYHRVARRPVGTPLGPLRLFRFSDHLGWAAALPLAVVLLPKLVAIKTAAANLLVVTATLYALRGAAVALFGLYLVGGSSVLLGVMSAVLILLMLPVVAGGAILLGVLDAGLDLRRRWGTPQTGG